MKWFVPAIVLVAVVAAWCLWTPDKPRRVLEPQYLRSTADYLDVAGLRLHVRDDGSKDAPAVILLHGFGSSLHTWEPWARTLSRTHRVIRYDLPGAALTGPDPTGDYREARGLQVLNALMDALGLARASIVGNSMGGKLAWAFAAEHPDRVDKLVLISPDGFASPGFEYGKKPEVPAIAGLMRFVLPKFMLRQNLAPAYGDPARLSDQTVRRYYDLLLAPGVRGAMIARMEQVLLEPPEPRLARITAPTLIVWGERDALIPFSNAADYDRVIPNSSVVSFPDLGHVPHEEAPDTTLVPVAEFLRRPS